MVPKNCPIVIVLRQLHYCAGDVVCGKALINFDKPFKIKELYASLVGRIHTYITKDVNYSTADHDTHQTQSYRAIKYVMHQKIRFERETELSGFHEYKFQFHLPANIPPTIKDNFGGITYTLTVEAKKGKFLALSPKVSVEIFVLYITPPPMKVRAYTDVGIKPRMECMLKTNTTTPYGFLEGELKLTLLNRFRNVRIRFLVETWAKAEGQTDARHRDMELDKIPFNIIQENVSLPFHVNLPNVDNASTFIDDQIYQHRVYLQFTIDRLGRDVHLKIPIEVGYPNVTEAQNLIRSIIPFVKSKGEIMFDTSLQLEDFTTIDSFDMSEKDAEETLLEEGEVPMNQGTILKMEPIEPSQTMNNKGQKKCPSCDSSNVEGAIYCIKCGFKLL